MNPKYQLIYGGTALISLSICLVSPSIASALWPFGVVAIIHGVVLAINEVS